MLFIVDSCWYFGGGGGWFNIFGCGFLLIVGVALGLGGGESERKVRLESFAVVFSLGYRQVTKKMALDGLRVVIDS